MTNSSAHYYGTGRRKGAVARVFLKPGDGRITVNNTSLEDYFFLKTACMVVCQPLRLLKMDGRLSLNITVKGGGIMGQAGAIRHGGSRALVKYDEEFLYVDGTGGSASSEHENNNSSFRKILRSAGYITRDSRVVERKKVGRRKARKKEQYSKR